MHEAREMSGVHMRGDQKRFDRFAHGTKIEAIRWEEMPEEAREFFEHQSRQFIDPDKYRAKNFSDVFRLKLPNEDIAYAAMQKKQYHGETGQEESTYVVMFHEQHMTGYIEIRWDLSSKSEEIKNKPFVGFTKTMPEFLRQGLGVERLRLANALTQMFYKRPLFSDTLVSPVAARVWRKLVEQGEAVRFTEGAYDRFAFKE